MEEIIIEVTNYNKFVSSVDGRRVCNVFKEYVIPVGYWMGGVSVTDTKY
jgi:hypothetical protein